MSREVTHTWESPGKLGIVLTAARKQTFSKINEETYYEDPYRRVYVGSRLATITDKDLERSLRAKDTTAPLPLTVCGLTRFLC